MKFKPLPDTTQLSAFYLDCNMLNLHSPSQSIGGVLSTALLASSIPTWMPFRLSTNTSNELPSLSNSHNPLGTPHALLHKSTASSFH